MANQYEYRWQNDWRPSNDPNPYALNHEYRLGLDLVPRQNPGAIPQISDQQASAMAKVLIDVATVSYDLGKDIITELVNINIKLDCWFRSTLSRLLS